MNILFSSDDNYARHLGVAIYSILLYNKDVEEICFYVVNNHIKTENLDKLETIVKGNKNANITFISFEDFEKDLHLILAWPISLSSYARLFVGEMLPKEIDKVLYLDCDIVVNGSLSDLWNTDLEDYCLGAIQDIIPSKTKKAVGVLPHQRYFNAGVLLIDLKQWRMEAIGKKCLDFIGSHQGCVAHHDQGVLNGVLNGQWKRLPLKYNVMTIHYMMSQSKIRKYYNDETSYYDNLEVNEAIGNPSVVHFTPSFTARPWEKHCHHPLRNMYINLLCYTPWYGCTLDKDHNPWYVTFINMCYRVFPII